MNRILLRKTIVLAAFLCLFATGCTQTANETTERPIQIALTQDLLSFDPMQTSDIFSEAILRCVYTSLYDFDDNLTLRPKLVKKETVLDEYSWNIQIHDDVLFHDGSRLTAEDVVFSIERARSGGRTQKLLEMVEEVRFVDDTTFFIRSREPYADMLSLFAKAETSIVSKAVVQSPGYDFKVPVGAGPFKLLAREEKSRIRLERFDNYYLEKAASKYLNFLVIITEQERTAALLNGDVDILFNVSAYDCEKLRLSQNVRLLHSPSSKIEYLSLNNHKEPLNKPTVRHAISHAINRDKITGSVYHGYSVSSSSLIPKGILGHLDGIVDYNPDEARKLLKKAGLEKGFTFNVITIDTIRKNTLEHIKLDLAKVGIHMNYQLVSMKDAASMMMQGKHDAILVGWAFNADPNSVIPLLLGTGSGKSMNSSNYSNATVDTLMQQGRAERDRDKKRQIYEQINTIVTEESPIVVLQNPMVLSATRDAIEGVHCNPQGLFQYESLYRKQK